MKKFQTGRDVAAIFPPELSEPTSEKPLKCSCKDLSILTRKHFREHVSFPEINMKGSKRNKKEVGIMGRR